EEILAFASEEPDRDADHTHRDPAECPGMEMREQRVPIERAEELRRVRETEKRREREDDEAVLERLGDLSACAHYPSLLRVLARRVGLARAGVERDDLHVLGQRAAGNGELRDRRELLHAELV